MGSCHKTIEINASVARVWDTISDFHDMSWAPGVITSVTNTGDKGGKEIGAQRVLNELFHETLIKYDPDNTTFSYTIDDGPGPVAKDAVNDYVGVVKLTATDNGCLVEWSSSFASDNDSEVADFCNPIYSAALSAMKKTIEQ